MIKNRLSGIECRRVGAVIQRLRVATARHGPYAIGPTCLCSAALGMSVRICRRQG